MRKLSIVVITLLLVLSLGQIVAAQETANIALKLGYDKKEYHQLGSHYPNNTRTFVASAPIISLSGEAYIYDNFSLSVASNISFGHWNDSADVISTPDKHPFFSISLNPSAKYTILSGNTYKAGVQLGAYGEYFTFIFSEYYTYHFTGLFIIPGIYGEIYVIPKLKLSLDASFPIFGIFEYYESDSVEMEGSNFFNVFFYDAKLSVLYDITPHISLGIEGVVSNTNAFALYWGVRNLSTKNNIAKPNFSIGVKVQYNF